MLDNILKDNIKIAILEAVSRFVVKEGFSIDDPELLYLIADEEAAGIAFKIIEEGIISK